MNVKCRKIGLARKICNQCSPSPNIYPALFFSLLSVHPIFPSNKMSPTFAGCMEPSDVIFALDASGSITSTNFKKVVDFAKNVVLDLPVDARMRVGLETFSNNEKVRKMFRLPWNVSMGTGGFPHDILFEK